MPTPRGERSARPAAAGPGAGHGLPQGLPRPGAPRRLAAWYVTGPLGHLVAGTLDVGELFVRMLWLRVRGRRIEWW